MDDDTSDEASELFVKAVRRNDVDYVREALKDPRVCPSYKENKAMGYATGLEDTEILRLLLDDGRADPNMVRGDRVIGLDTMAEYYGSLPTERE